MTVYLSPSTKDYQISTVTGISEKETMKLFSEEIAKNLENLGISVFISNTPLSPSQSATDSNSKGADFHIALSSLRSTDNAERGARIYYSSTDAQSKDYAEAVAESLKEIYPTPSTVEAIANDSFIELIGTDSPAIIISISNQNNTDDVKWFSESMGDIAQNIAVSVGNILGIENNTKPLTALGIASSPSGYATIRKTPSPSARIIGRVQNGSPVRIIGMIGDWYAIIAKSTEGYVLSGEITAETPEQ